jgi:deoxyribose-phosphate aldolase
MTFKDQESNHQHREMPAGKLPSVKALSSKIDSTFSPPGASWQEVLAFANRTAQYRFRAIAVQGCWAADVKQVIKGGDVLLSVFVGYSLGGSSSESKIVEVERGIAAGADMFEYLPNLGYLRTGLFSRFKDEMNAVVKAAAGRPVNAALELPQLNIEERIKATLLAEEAGVASVTNSSGWGTGGPATEEGIRLLRSTVGSSVGVKAAGGIKDLNTALSLLADGADVLGTWSGFQIVDELKQRLSGK